MRQIWFNRIGKMITQVRRATGPFWGNQQIEELFRVHTETARNLAIAIGRCTTGRRSYAVETGNLLAFLEEFRILLCPATRLKEHRSQAIRSAQTLFQQKLERGRRASKQVAASRTTHYAPKAGSESRIQDASLTHLLQVQINCGKKQQGKVAEINDPYKQQKVPTTKPIHPRARKKTQPFERFQTAMDFTGGGDQPASETSGDLPEQQ